MRSSRQPDLDTSLWQVGWDGDEVAGSVQTWIWKEENETLGTKRAWLESVSDAPASGADAGSRGP